MNAKIDELEARFRDLFAFVREEAARTAARHEEFMAGHDPVEKPPAAA